MHSLIIRVFKVSKHTHSSKFVKLPPFIGPKSGYNKRGFSYETNHGQKASDGQEYLNDQTAMDGSTNHWSNSSEISLRVLIVTTTRESSVA
jgi:hypothetical protein